MRLIFIELKNEKTNSSQISFDKLPLNLDLDDGYFGFDSVTVSQSVIYYFLNLRYIIIE